MRVPDDTGEEGSATSSLTASAERVKYADCVKIPCAQQLRDDAQQPRDDAQLTGERDSRWTLEQSKRQRHQKSHGSGLQGAERVMCTPCHLRGLCQESSAADVISCCRERNVHVTGCYLIRTRVWGTQSAKLFINTKSLDSVLAEDFWPDLIKCRKYS